MKLRPLVVLAIVALVWLAGCATVSFKRGAGPGGAKADEDACRATTTSPEAYADCLRERGWMVSTPGSGSATAVAPAEEPEPAAAPAKQPAPAAAPAAKPAPADDGYVPAPAAPGKTERSTSPPAVSGSSSSKGSAVTTTPPADQAPSTKPASTAVAPSKKPVDPTAKVTVSSWWKMGGTNADLDAAVKACVDELGPAHQPNIGPTEVTIALRDCLRAKKWFAVGGTGGVGAK